MLDAQNGQEDGQEERVIVEQVERAVGQRGLRAVAAEIGMGRTALMRVIHHRSRPAFSRTREKLRAWAMRAQA